MTVGKRSIRFERDEDWDRWLRLPICICFPGTRSLIATWVNASIDTDGELSPASFGLSPCSPPDSRQPQTFSQPVQLALTTAVDPGDGDPPSNQLSHRPGAPAAHFPGALCWYPVFWMLLIHPPAGVSKSHRLLGTKPRPRDPQPALRSPFFARRPHRDQLCHPDDTNKQTTAAGQLIESWD